MSKERIRLTGRLLFIYYFKKIGIENKSIMVKGCTNKRILGKRTGIGVDLLVNIFTRKGLCYYENDDVVIMKLYASDIEKGAQSVMRKGKGGMEKFIERYTIKKVDNY
jgi:hypothetical protein